MENKACENTSTEGKVFSHSQNHRGFKMNGLSKYYIKKIIQSFSGELTATETSKKLKINRNTVNKYYRIIREAVSDYQGLQKQYHGTELSNARDRFYFSWHSNQGLIFDQAQGDAMYALRVVNNRIFVEEANDNEYSKENTKLGSGDSLLLQEILREEGAQEVTEVQEDIDTPPIVEAFFTYAKEKLTKFYGVKKEYTFLYLKELEFRFNNRNKDLAQLIWRILPHHSSIWAKSRKKKK